MVFTRNKKTRAEGIKGRIPGGVAIIFSPSVVEAWRATGSKSPIMTPVDSK